MASHILIPLLCLVCCVVSQCRKASMPCTRLQKVGVWMSSNSWPLCLEQGSMTRQASPILCCTGQHSVVTVRWHITSLQNSSWTHRTGTRCVGGARGLCWFQSARSTCVHGLVFCSEACCDKTGVTWTSLCTVLCCAFRVLSHSLLNGSCLVMDHQCIVFTSFSQPVIAGFCRIYVAGIFDSIIV